MNQKVRITNKSGLKGVHWREDQKRFVARIKSNGKETFLGNFKTAEEAHAAYCAAAPKYHGEFARTA